MGASDDSITRRVSRHYDSLDRLYRDVWGEHVHHGYWITGREPAELAVEQLVDLVARSAAVGPGTRVCDVGCGYGATARRLATVYGAEVTGLTISPAQQRYARHVAPGGNPTILLRDWLVNELPDRSFDAVVAIESLSHMGERPRVFGECHRVLAPGGRLVVLDWLAPARAQRWQQRLLLEPICREGHLPSLDSLDAYGRMLIRAGFSEVRGIDISAHVWRTWPIVLARAVARLPTDAELREVLRDRSHTEHGFLAMVIRLMVGFATRGFRYGMLTARRP